MIKLLSTNFELRTLCGPQWQEISSWGSPNQSEMVVIHSQQDATSFSGPEEGLGTETDMTVEKRSHQIWAWRATEPREALEGVPFPHPAANSAAWNQNTREGLELWEVGPFLYEDLAPAPLEVRHRTATLMGGGKGCLVHWAGTPGCPKYVMPDQTPQIHSDGKTHPTPMSPNPCWSLDVKNFFSSLKFSLTISAFFLLFPIWPYLFTVRFYPSRPAFCLI